MNYVPTEQRLKKALNLVTLAREETIDQELKGHLATIESEIAVVLTDLDEGHYPEWSEELRGHVDAQIRAKLARDAYWAAVHNPDGRFKWRNEGGNLIDPERKLPVKTQPDPQASERKGL